MIKKLEQLEKELNKHIIGREKAIKTLILALSSGEHILILGKHGEAKTLMVNLLKEITNLKTYYKQIHNETTLKEIVGMINPISYKNGKLELIKTDFWFSNVLFFDEFLRGRSEFLDFLLEVMNEKKCSKTILGEVKLPIWLVIATSNPLTEEYNTEKLDLATKDRFSFIINFEHLIENNSNEVLEVLNLKENNINKVVINIKELKDIRNKALKKVNVDTKLVLDIFLKLRDLGFNFSTRLIKKYKEILKVNAFINGRDKVSISDYIFVSEVMLLNRFDKLDLETISKIINEIITYKEYKPIVNELNSLKDIKDDLEYIKSSIDLIKKVNSEYAEIPNGLKELMDKHRKELKEVIYRNIENIKVRDILSLDTEQFKSIINEFIEYNRIETKPLDSKKLSDLNKIISKLKYCEIEKEKVGGYTIVRIKPKLELKSFREINKLKEILKDKKILSKYSYRF